MYFCKLNIAIFSQNSILEEIISVIKPLEHFEHTFIKKDILDEQVIKNSDIILWNLPENCQPFYLRNLCKEGAVLIICSAHDKINTYDENNLKAADEFWETPFNSIRIQLQFTHLLEKIKLKRDLYLTQTYLDTAIDSIPDMVWFKALDGTHVKVNKAFCTTVGKTREDITGRDHCYIWDVSREDFKNGEGVCKETEDAVIREKRTLQFTENVKSQHGLRQFRTYKSPLFDIDKVTILGTVGVGHDVTDLVNMNTELEILLSSMPYAILLRDNTGYILNVNNKFEEYFNINKKNVIGVLYDTWNTSAFEKERIINKEGFIEAKVHAGTGKILEIHEDNIYDIFQNIVGKLCIFRDVTMERKLEEQILCNSNTDFMTGLYNRRCLYQFIHNNRNDKTISLLYVDLDNFKSINDMYGHKVGDDVLILTAKLLQKCFQDEFIARIGGDEFLVVCLGDIEIKELENGAKRLLKRMKETYHSSKLSEVLSASIGIAQTKDPNLDIDILIQQSDLALYKAKESGKARFCVYSNIQK